MTVNTVFLGSVGRTLEGKLGSYYFLNVVLVFGTLCALLQILLELLLSLCYPTILHQCLSGFSGVLFGMLVLALRVTKTKKQSMYGFCYIPKFLYPWLLLIIWQMITYEHISIVANIAGIIVGYACILCTAIQYKIACLTGQYSMMYAVKYCLTGQYNMIACLTGQYSMMYAVKYCLTSQYNMIACLTGQHSMMYAIWIFIN